MHQVVQLDWWSDNDDQNLQEEDWKAILVFDASFFEVTYGRSGVNFQPFWKFVPCCHKHIINIKWCQNHCESNSIQLLPTIKGSFDWKKSACIVQRSKTPNGQIDYLSPSISRYRSKNISQEPGSSVHPSIHHQSVIHPIIEFNPTQHQIWQSHGRIRSSE